MNVHLAFMAEKVVRTTRKHRFYDNLLACPVQKETIPKVAAGKNTEKILQFWECWCWSIINRSVDTFDNSVMMLNLR